MALISWIVWIGWMVVGLAYELFAVFTEKKLGTLPLTRVVRDRVMRRSTPAKLGVVFFLTWLWLHFTLKFNF